MCNVCARSVDEVSEPIQPPFANSKNTTENHAGKERPVCWIGLQNVGWKGPIDDEVVKKSVSKAQRNMKRSIQLQLEPPMFPGYLSFIFFWW
jgi:hypothetical protein